MHLLARDWQPKLGVWAAEEIEAKRVGKEASLRPLLRTVAVATAGKMGAKWDFSPAVAADALLPPRLLDPVMPRRDTDMCLEHPLKMRLVRKTQTVGHIGQWLAQAQANTRLVDALVQLVGVGR